MLKATSLLLLCLVLNVPVQAEIYKYVDEDGNVMFSDVYKKGRKRIDVPDALEPVAYHRRKATSAEASRCLEIHRNDFRDPRSAYVVSATVAEYRMPPNAKGQTKHETIVEIDVSARNGFGGASRRIMYCPIM